MVKVSELMSQVYENGAANLGQLPSPIENRFTEVNEQLADIEINIDSRGINIKSPPPPYVAAVGDGVADDTIAIQQILSNFNNVYAPKGVYLITSSLSGKSEQVFRGAGFGLTELKWGGGNEPVLILADLVNSISRSEISNFSIKGNNTATSGLFLRYLANGTYLHDIEIFDCEVGVDLSIAYYCNFENVRVRRGGTSDGWRIHDSAGQVNGVNFRDCQAHTCGGAGFRIRVIHGCTFSSCLAEANQQEAFAIERGGGTVLQDCYAEHNGLSMGIPITVSVGTTVNPSDRVYGLVISGGFYLGEEDGYTFKVDKANDVIINSASIEISNSSNRPINHVLATSNSNGVLFFGSILSNADTNFAGNVTVYSNKNTATILPNGLKTKDLAALTTGGFIDVVDSALWTTNKRFLGVKGNGSSLAYMAINAGNTEAILTTQDTSGVSGEMPFNLSSKVRVNKLKTASSHPTNYAQVYVNTDTGELYRI